MRIKGYPAVVSKAQGDTECIAQSANSMVFLRYMRQGLVVVHTCPDDGRAVVEMVRDGYHWLRRYEHAPITTRQASLLVNRFIADMSKPDVYETEVQP